MLLKNKVIIFLVILITWGLMGLCVEGLSISDQQASRIRNNLIERTYEYYVTDPIEFQNNPIELEQLPQGSFQFRLKYEEKEGVVLDKIIFNNIELKNPKIKKKGAIKSLTYFFQNKDSEIHKASVNILFESVYPQNITLKIKNFLVAIDSNIFILYKNSFLTKGPTVKYFYSFLLWALMGYSVWFIFVYILRKIYKQSTKTSYKYFCIISFPALLFFLIFSLFNILANGILYISIKILFYIVFLVFWVGFFILSAFLLIGRKVTLNKNDSIKIISGFLILASIALIGYKLLYWQQLFDPVFEINRLLPEKMRTIRENKNTTQLPVFEIYVKEKKLALLDSNLPQSGRDKPVSAQFKYKDKVYDVKIRYRGDNDIHWKYPKKSWRIIFEKNDLFNGYKAINLVNSKSKAIINDVLEYNLARKIGIHLAPEAFLAHVRLNDTYQGVLFFYPQPNKYYFKKIGMPRGNLYGEKNDLLRPHDLFWDKSNFRKYCSLQGKKDDFSDLEMLLDILKIEEEEIFKEKIERILDIEQYLLWYCHARLCLSLHQDCHNIKLYFDSNTGKFQEIPWDLLGFGFASNSSYSMDAPHSINATENYMVSRILQIPEFNHRKNVLLWRLLHNEASSENVIHMVDELYEKSKPDVYCDFLKHDRWEEGRIFSNREFDFAVRGMKTVIRDSYHSMKEQLQDANVSFKYRCDVDNTNDKPIGILAFKTTKAVSLQLESITFSFQDNGSFDNSFSIWEDTNNNGTWDKGDKEFLKPNIVLAGNSLTLTLDKLLFAKFNSNVYGIQLDNWELSPTQSQQLYFVIPRKDTYAILDQLNKAEYVVKAYNAVTGEKVRVNYEKRVDLFYVTKGQSIFNEDVMITQDACILIEPHATLKFGSHKSLIIEGKILAVGTDGSKITFTNLEKDKKWGGIYFNGKGSNKIKLKHVIVENASHPSYGGLAKTGSVELLNAQVVVENSIIRNAFDDDGLHCEQSEVLISGCDFTENASDAIDLDFCTGVIKNCHFRNNGGDSIDLSASNIHVISNQIASSGDKGISVGEKTKAQIADNTISHSGYGVAVKDLSEAVIKGNTIINNRIGIAVYRKKEFLGGGYAQVGNNILKFNDKDTEIDSFSKVDVMQDSRSGD